MEHKYIPDDSLQDKNIVTQSIHLVESSYRLKTLEQKMFLVLISQIQPTDKDFISYYFKVRDFAAFLNVSSNSMYKELLNNTENIMKKVIRIKNKITGDITLTHWVQKAVYYKNKGMIEIQFDPGLKPYLLNLKNQFVSYSIQNIKEMKSFYSIRIYEILKQYQKIGSRKFTVERLKDILGIEPNEYKLYGHFKDKVINRSIEEINEKTDIKVSYEEKKDGRKVYLLIFNIEKNKNFKPQKGDTKEVEFQKGVMDIRYFLTENISMGLDEAEDFIKTYGESHLLKIANNLANHKKVIDKNTLRVEFFSLLKKPMGEIQEENSFMGDEDYLFLEEAAKNHPEYESKKIHFLMALMEEFEKVKNRITTLEESINNIKNIHL